MVRLPALSEELIKSEEWNGVDPKYFAPTTWIKQIDNPVGRNAYAKFIKLMIRRISKEKSSLQEVESLANLLGCERNSDFLHLAVPYLSDFITGDKFQDSRSQAQNAQVSFLCKVLLPIVLERQRREQAGLLPLDMQQQYAPGGHSLKDLIQTMFGQESESGLQTHQKKYLYSHIQLAYPPDVIQDMIDEYGSDSEREQLKNDLAGLQLVLGEPPISTRQETSYPRYLPSRRRQANCVRIAIRDDAPSCTTREPIPDKKETVESTESKRKPKKSVSFIGISAKGPIAPGTDDQGIDENESSTTHAPQLDYSGHTPTDQSPETPAFEDEDRNQIPCDAINGSKRRKPKPILLTFALSKMTDPSVDQLNSEFNRNRARLEKEAKEGEALRQRSWPNSLTTTDELIPVRPKEKRPPVTLPIMLSTVVLHNPPEYQVSSRQHSVADYIREPGTPWQPHYKLTSDGLPKDKMFESRGGLNSTNSPYYLGRPDIGPGQAPEEKRQVGFKPLGDEGVMQVMREVKAHRDRHADLLRANGYA